MIFIVKKIMNILLAASQYSPIALIWMIKAFAFDWIAQKHAFSGLRMLAPKIGFRHKPSDVTKEFGELYGNINGHGVCVKPDNHMESKVIVNLRNRFKGLDIELSKPHYRLEKNTVDFKTEDWKFNVTFKTKRASEDLAGKIIKNRQFINLLNSFYRKWIFKLETISISDTEIYCTMKYGFNFFPYIPASKLEGLVAELVLIADTLESMYE